MEPCGTMLWEDGLLFNGCCPRLDALHSGEQKGSVTLALIDLEAEADSEGHYFCGWPCRISQSI